MTSVWLISRNGPAICFHLANSDISCSQHRPELWTTKRREENIWVGRFSDSSSNCYPQWTNKARIHCSFRVTVIFKKNKLLKSIIRHTSMNYEKFINSFMKLWIIFGLSDIVHFCEGMFFHHTICWLANREWLSIIDCNIFEKRPHRFIVVNASDRLTDQ